jgi:hypothetical protein
MFVEPVAQAFRAHQKVALLLRLHRDADLDTDALALTAEEEVAMLELLHVKSFWAYNNGKESLPYPLPYRFFNTFCRLSKNHTNTIADHVEQEKNEHHLPSSSEVLYVISVRVGSSIVVHLALGKT